MFDIGEFAQFIGHAAAHHIGDDVEQAEFGSIFDRKVRREFDRTS